MENKYDVEFMEDSAILQLNIKEIKRVKPDYKLTKEDISNLLHFIHENKSWMGCYERAENKKHYFLLDYKLIFANLCNLSQLTKTNYGEFIMTEFERRRARLKKLKGEK